MGPSVRTPLRCPRSDGSVGREGARVRKDIMRELDPGYTVEIDKIDKSHWHELLKSFDDATFYQTWSYGERFWGRDRMSHAVLAFEGRVIALAQVRIFKSPIPGVGAAYLNWGPLWRRSGEGVDRARLRNILRALRNEYVVGRKLNLRILPKIYLLPESEDLRSSFREEGFSCRPERLQTFAVDLSPSLEVIRQNLHKSWKGSLKYGEKQDLVVFEVTDPGQYAIVASLGHEMQDRKHFSGGDNEAALEVNADLPPELRLKILLCSHQGEPVAALAWSNIGKVSFPMLGGTGHRALQFKASFLLFWRMVQTSKENGFAFCDLAGVHEKRNPGGYFFKKGLAGKDAQEMTYLGQFDAYHNLISHFLFKTAVATKESFVNGIKMAKVWLRGRLSKPAQGTKSSSPSE